jgi:beta-lactamase superfamily II metal-dependent hydrolase
MPIAELAGGLTNDRLHIVVFGPGYGESVAVYVPDGGWLICDSLSSAHGSTDLVPAAELLTSRQERAAALILTHPHDDHVAGFDRLVQRFAEGPVGRVGIELPEDGFTERDDASLVLATSNRAKALAAISSHWQRYPDAKWEMSADDPPLQLGPATVEVLHPDDAYVQRGRPDPTQAPNAYSTPLLICWAQTRILLGADLPNAQWTDVLAKEREQELADHHGLKAPHHGSTKSLPDALLRAGDRDRLVVLAPWQRGGNLLPKLGEKGGIAWLLARRSAVSLTSPGRALRAELARPVSISDFTAAIDRRPLPGGVGSVELKHSYDPDESWVAATFNRRGDLEAVELGRDACVIVERNLVSEAGPYPYR